MYTFLYLFTVKKICLQSKERRKTKNRWKCSQVVPYPSTNFFRLRLTLVAEQRPIIPSSCKNTSIKFIFWIYLSTIYSTDLLLVDIQRRYDSHIVNILWTDSWAFQIQNDELFPDFSKHCWRTFSCKMACYIVATISRTLILSKSIIVIFTYVLNPLGEATLLWS